MPKRIDDITVQKIKGAANIVDVVGDFFTLYKKGTNYQCLCPFHDDRHIGSFVVRPPGRDKGNTYRCFSCDAKGGPIEFLINYNNMTYHDALLYLAQKYGIYVPDGNKVFEKVKPAKPKEMKEQTDNRPKRTWPAGWINFYNDVTNDNFVNWLISQSWDECQRERIAKALKDYHVGHVGFDTTFQGVTEHHEWTIWWQMDEEGILHNGHLMKYLPDGHRDKTTEYNQTWLHARMKKAIGVNHFDDEKESASYCLFGQHLLNRYPTAQINIVESEKTAVTMAVAYGNHPGRIWMAVCGMQNLNRERLAPLIDQGRTIVLYPDRDGIKKWEQKAREIDYQHMSKNTQAVQEWWEPSDGEKADIADVVLRIINNNNTRK